MTESTTIALMKTVQIDLLDFLHNEEKKSGKRLSYSDAIRILLDNYKGD